MHNNENSTEETPQIVLVPAGILKRLTNYIIDILFFSVISIFFLKITNPGFADSLKEPKDISFSFNLLLNFSFCLYISCLEAISKGKSIGKRLTGTRAVNKDGTAISPETAFTRGLCRFIPFEQISAFSIPSNPWHDRLSKTIVIDEALSSLPASKK